MDQESRRLAHITEQLEQRHKRAKWDWITLGCAMLISAALAAAGAFLYTKTTIEQDSFDQAITRIAQDTNTTWCDIANGQIIDSQSGAKFFAIHMPNYQEAEGPE